MPKKRSVNPGFSKRLQRLYKGAAAGPILPEPETPREAPEPEIEAAGTPKTHHDMQRLLHAAEKRRRKAARNLQRT